MKLDMFSFCLGRLCDKDQTHQWMFGSVRRCNEHHEESPQETRVHNERSPTPPGYNEVAVVFRYLDALIVDPANGEYIGGVSMVVIKVVDLRIRAPPISRSFLCGLSLLSVRRKQPC